MTRGPGRPPYSNAALPLPFLSGRKWVWRSEDVVTVAAVLDVPPPSPAKVARVGELVPIAELAMLLGLSHRTITRRTAQARAEKAALAEAVEP